MDDFRDAMLLSIKKRLEYTTGQEKRMADSGELFVEFVRSLNRVM